jgi:hypothetical protein
VYGSISKFRLYCGIGCIGIFVNILMNEILIRPTVHLHAKCSGIGPAYTCYRLWFKSVSQGVKAVKKGWKYERKVGRDRLGYPASMPNITVGFFLWRCGLQVENNNKFSHQFLQVTFEMLQMSQVRLSLLFSWDGLQPSLYTCMHSIKWFFIFHSSNF